VRAAFAVWCALLLSACESQVLYTDLSEHEANEIISVMYGENLKATKVATKNGRFRVDTDQQSFSKAVSLLQSYGLPRERFDSMGEVFAKDGFVSSPLEERARLNYAQSQEISRTIASIDGVVMARVHLAVPKKEHLTDKVQASSASVFVKHRADTDLTDAVGKIKSIVVNAFENLPYENVTVGLFAAGARPLQSPSDVRLEVATASFLPVTLNKHTRYVLITALGLLFLGVGLVLIYQSLKPQISTSGDRHD